MKKIWRLFAALSLLTVFAFSSCAIYIGGGYHGKYYNLEWIKISDSDYNTAYKGKTYSEMMTAKSLWTTDAYKTVYEKRTYITDDQLRTFLKNHNISDEGIQRTFTEVESGNCFIFYDQASNMKGVLYLEEL